MDVDVTKLTCIYWSLMKNIMEAEWYGIKCNIKKLKEDVLEIRTLLSLLRIDCEIPYSIECTANQIIKNKDSFCNLISDQCDSRSESEYEVIGILG